MGQTSGLRDVTRTDLEELRRDVLVDRIMLSQLESNVQPAVNEYVSRAGVTRRPTYSDSRTPSRRSHQLVEVHHQLEEARSG